MPGLAHLTALQETDIVLYRERWIAYIHICFIFVMHITVLAGVFLKHSTQSKDYLNKGVLEYLNKILVAVSVVSAIGTYAFMTHTKTYEVFDFKKFYL